MKIRSCPQLGSQDLFPDSPGLSEVGTGAERRHVAGWAYLLLNIPRWSFVVWLAEWEEWEQDWPV